MPARENSSSPTISWSIFRLPPRMMPMMRRALLAELGRKILLENLREAVDGAQRRSQIMRNGIGEGLQVLIGGREFLGSLPLALLQFRVFAAQSLHIQRARDDRQDRR